MLFYTSEEDHLDMIPSSYNVIALTQSHILGNCRYVRIDNNALIPNINKGFSKKEKKNMYINKLKDMKLLVAYIAKDTFGNQSESIVIYCTKDDIERCGFNFIKTLCKFMEKKYNIKPFKFTTTVTREMRRDAYMTDDDKYKVLKDCQQMHNLLVNNKDV